MYKFQKIRKFKKQKRILNLYLVGRVQFQPIKESNCKVLDHFVKTTTSFKLLQTKNIMSTNYQRKMTFFFQLMKLRKN